MKITIKGQINWRPARWEGANEFAHHPCDIAGHTKVMDYNIEVDIPDDFDPRAKQVEMLQAEKIKLMADFHARCIEIERKISELTAITCEVPA